MDIHLPNETGDPTFLSDVDPLQTRVLTADQKKSIREVVVYWSQNRGSLNNRTWKQQLQDKIKQLNAAVGVNRNVPELSDLLLVAALQKLLEEWQQAELSPNEGDEVLFTPGSPFKQYPVYGTVGTPSPGGRTRRVYISNVRLQPTALQPTALPYVRRPPLACSPGSRPACTDLICPPRPPAACRRKSWR